MIYLASLSRFLAGAVCLLLLVGCTTETRERRSDSGNLQASPNVISASELGRRLGFVLARTQTDLARLTRGNDSLVIVAWPASEVYFNGNRVIRTTGIHSRDGQIWMPATLEGQIRQAMQPGASAGRTPVPTPTRPRPPTAPVTGRVVLDAGHGGKDPGARAGGLIEKSLVLDVTLQAAEQLRRRGVTVMLTRKTDRFLELEDRVAAANTFKADLFLAIHADYNPSPQKSGHSILLPQSGNWWANQAAILLNRALVSMGSPSRAIRTDDRGLFVLRHTRCPAILLEIGFLSNSADAARLRDPAFRSRIATGIANGICDYLRKR